MRPARNLADAATQAAHREVEAVLANHLSPAVSRAVLDCAMRQATVRSGRADFSAFLSEIRRGVRLFARTDEVAQRCLGALRRFEPGVAATVVQLERESDIVQCQTAARKVCEALGFSIVLQTKVLTAVSELARNVVHYAGSGNVRTTPIDHPARGIEVVVSDRGPGIPNLDDVLAGRVRSRTGMGVGLRGTKALADEFQVDTRPGSGTTVTFRKFVPA